MRRDLTRSKDSNDDYLILERLAVVKPDVRKEQFFASETSGSA